MGAALFVPLRKWVRDAVILRVSDRHAGILEVSDVLSGAKGWAYSGDELELQRRFS